MHESQKKEDTVARNLRKVANRFVFPMIHGSGVAKAGGRGAMSCGHRRNEKLRVAVAQSAFSSQNVQDTSASDQKILEAPMSTIARCGSEKHICKSKCTKHTLPGPLFEVGVWKNGTPLWREAHLQGKM